MNAFTPILPGLEDIVKPFKFPATPHEYKITSLRECPTPENLQLCDTPDAAAGYWRMHIPSHPYFNPECEPRFGHRPIACLVGQGNAQLF